MKVVILCGGLGTRLSEETHLRPKPMVTIGSKPILWHIMNIYSLQGFRAFVLALGYKGEIIRDYFLNYYSLNSDLSIDMSSGAVNYLRRVTQDWMVDLIDTGPHTMTGGRLNRLRNHLLKSGTFMLTYGDGVANVSIKKLIEFHRSHGKIATVTSVRPTARFGNIVFENDHIIEFKEKPNAGEGWINGGFFVLEPEIFDYLNGDEAVLEGEPLERLARDGQLMGYKHKGFWQCMDTLRDRQYLEELEHRGDAPWFQLGGTT